MNIGLKENKSLTDPNFNRGCGTVVEHFEDNIETVSSDTSGTTQSTEKSAIELIFEVFGNQVEVIY